jgi:cell division protein FtsW
MRAPAGRYGADGPVRLWRQPRAGTGGARRQPPDAFLLLGTAAAVGLGLVMILSASSVTAAALVHDPFYYFQRQLMWAGVGAAAFVICLRIDYWRWRDLAPLIVAATFGLLGLVLVAGRVVNGSRRWLGFGPLLVQPSEFAKLTMVIVVSAWLAARSERQVRSFLRTTLPILGLVGAAAGLILLEPDLGTAVALAATSVVLLYVAGVPPLQFVAIGGAGVAALAAAIFGSAYRRERFLAFLHPQAQAQGSGYHILQSLYALGSGGLFGVGLGQSRQKWFYLPEEHTDFIFAVLGEELGFIGGLLALSLFGLLIWRGFRIAARAPDLFGSLLAAGLTTMLAVQVIVNIGVVSGLLPVTGIPLPMISYGGSSLVFTLTGLGILANISRHVRT